MDNTEQPDLKMLVARIWSRAYLDTPEQVIEQMKDAFGVASIQSRNEVLEKRLEVYEVQLGLNYEEIHEGNGPAQQIVSLQSTNEAYKKALEEIDKLNLTYSQKDYYRGHDHGIEVCQDIARAALSTQNNNEKKV